MAKSKVPGKQQMAAKPLQGAAVGKTAARFSSVRIAVILAIVAVFTYANTLKNGYALDDVSSITKNTIVKQGISAIPQLLSTPYHLGFHPSDNDLYRPLSLVVFAVGEQFFPGSPAFGHLLNILLFGACVVALFFFLTRLFGEGVRAVAFVACLLFAVHPIHTEVVANIKSLDELLCFFFAFLALLSFTRYAASGVWLRLAAGGLCFFLSLLAKETSITFLAIIPLVFFFYLNDDKKRSTFITSTTIVVAGVYLAIRFYVLHAHHADMTTIIPFVDNALVNVPPPASRFATAVLLLGMYIKLLFVPWPLICDYSFNSIPYVGFGHWGFLLSLVIYVSLIAVGIYRLARNRKDVVAFAVLFFLITLSLFSNIFFLLGATMAERFVFFPSVGFCLGMAWLLGQWLQRNNTEGDALLRTGKTWAVLLPVAGVFMWLSVARNGDWVDNYTLYSADVQKAPDNMRLHWFRGNELSSNVFQAQTKPEMKRQAMLEGVNELRQAIAIYPPMLPAHEDLGQAFFMMQQYDSAMYHSRKVLEQDPDNAIALFNISGIYFSLAKYDTAIIYAHQSWLSNPGNFDLPRNIAFAYLQLKQFDSSIKYFKIVLAQYPDNEFCRAYLAKAVEGKGQIDSAGK